MVKGNNIRYGMFHYYTQKINDTVNTAQEEQLEKLIDVQFGITKTMFKHKCYVVFQAKAVISAPSKPS